MRSTSLAVLAAASAIALGMPGQAVAESPAQRCGPQNWFTIEYVASYPNASGSADGTYERRVPSRGGCASSWAHGDGQLSTSAITAQCKSGLEPRFGPYPFTVVFPGAPSHELRNRADCIELMLGVSSGRIDPGTAPLFPGGGRT